MSRLSPPPPYSEVEPDPPAYPGNEEELSFSREPIIGPTEYKASRSCQKVMLIYYFIKLGWKFLIPLLLFFFDVLLTSNYRRSVSRQRTENDWRACGAGCISALVNGILVGFNSWPQVYENCNMHKTIARHRFLSESYCFKGLFLFFLDMTLLTLWIFFVLPIDIDLDIANMLLILIPNLILLPYNLVVLLIVHCVESTDYTPLNGNGKFGALQKHQETSSLAEYPLSVKESSAFRIVIQNCGHEAWSSPILIERDVAWRTKGKKDIWKWKVKKFEIRFKPPDELAPGKSWTLVPEPSIEPGAIRIHGFRAFGWDKGQLVTTTLSRIFDERELVKMVEEYSREDEEIPLVENDR